MCNAALEEPPPPPDKTCAGAELAAAAAAGQGGMDITSSATPRLRRPPPTHHQTRHQHLRLSRQSGLRTPSEHRAASHPPSPAEASGSGSAGHSPTLALVEQRSQCDGGSRGSGSGSGSHQQRRERDGAADAGRRRDIWSLEKAVSVTWGAGEWLGLGLLRKRRRSGSSSFPCIETTATSSLSSSLSSSSSSGLASRRDCSREGGPAPSPLTPTPPAHPDSGNNSGCGFCGSRPGACRKQQGARFCRRDRRSGGGSGGGGGGRVGTVLFRAGALAALLALAWLLCLAASEFYVRTYCLQVRLMEAAQRPRGECPIVMLARASNGGWGAAVAPAAPAALPSLAGAVAGGEEAGGAEGGAAARAGEGDRERLRFGIILMCDEGMWPREYSDRSIQNKKGYAALHGYDVIVATGEDIDRSRPAAWSKLLVLQKHLGSYDYVIFVDIDAFIMNPTFKLEWILDVAQQQKETGGEEAWGAGSESDLIVTQDWNGPNSGVVFVRNSEFSRWLLQEWWDQKQFVRGNYPFQYEQRAMHFLLQTDVWKGRGLQFYANFEVVRARTAVIDQCAMNSYLVHPWQVLLGRTTLGTPASYVPGDFMLHFAGKKGRVRLSLVDYYYPRARKAMEEYSASLKSPLEGTATISRIGGGGGGGGP
eukprot:g6525.t1